MIIILLSSQTNNIILSCLVVNFANTNRSFRLMKKFDHPKKGSSVHLSFKEEEKEEKEEEIQEK